MIPIKLISENVTTKSPSKDTHLNIDLLNIFCEDKEDKEKTDYYNSFMDSLYKVISLDKYHLVVCVAKKGLVVFRAFMKKRHKKNGFELKIPMINTRTLCNYFKPLLKKELENNHVSEELNEYIEFLNKKSSNSITVQNFKVLVFDDTLNMGRNAYDCFKALERRGIKAENITYASPTINVSVFEKSSKNKLFFDLAEYQETQKTILYAKDKSNTVNKRVSDLFIPDPDTIKNYLNPYSSLGFVDSGEIISRAYQMNQFAHITDIPYTAYCSYAKSKEKIFNKKIREILENPENINLKYPVFKIRELDVQVCSTVGIKSYVVILDFNIATGAYAGIRVFDNQKKECITFFAFVTQQPFERADLKDEYFRFFGETDGKELIEKKSFITKISDNDSLWMSDYRKDKSYCKGCCKDNDGKCDKNCESEVENCEDSYFQLKAFLESASRRLMNLKTALLLWDFFNKLKGTIELGNNGWHDALIDDLTKCVSRQFFQFDYINNKKSKDENFKNEKRNELKAFFENTYKNLGIEKDLNNLLHYRDFADSSVKFPVDLPEDLFENYSFKCHPNDDGKSYDVLDKYVEKYKLSAPRKDNTSENYYLSFRQEFGGFFNDLNNKDVTEHKLPPFPVCRLMQKVIKRVTGRDFKELDENNENDKAIIFDCISALIAITEDGFAGTVSYMEPYKSSFDLTKDGFYLVNCAQHGESSIQTNKDYFSDFQCLNECLELNLTRMRMKNGDKQKYYEFLIEAVSKEIQKFKRENEQNPNYDKFINSENGIDKFLYCINSTFNVDVNAPQYDLCSNTILRSIYFIEDSVEMQKQKFGFDFNKDKNVIGFLNNIIDIYYQES
ncbi:MAG: hypothetical protein LBM93_00905 [Oscillospiraceae bacterium]|jgi:hypothetical protein|nr:hypothetical protein [Oscillospiraceae bacterium]